MSPADTGAANGDHSKRPFVGVRPSGWLGPDPAPQVREILAWAEHADELGFDVLFVGDRLLAAVGDGVNPVYDAAMLEPFVTLAAIAARTERIRLATLVAVVPYRHPAVLAKVTASLDVISDGRAVLGAGSGWNKTELAMFGVDERRRGRQMEDGLRLIRRLWEGEAITEEGEFWTLEGIRVDPMPVQRPGPPVWLGSFKPNDIAEWQGEVTDSQRRALSRVGRVADGWAPLTYSVVSRAQIDGRQLASSWEVIAESAAEAGRDASAIEIIYAHWMAIVRNDAERAACERVLARYFPGTYEEARETYLIGTPEEIVERIRTTTAPLERVDGYLFTPISDDTEQLDAIAEEIRPRLSAS
jgi:probable F420-dependent oxidoreductase